jgi:hydroxyacylglutathione hydrolase
MNCDQIGEDEDQRARRLIATERRAVCALAALLWFILAPQVWPEPVPGSLDVHWNEGAADCGTAARRPLQVHRYEPRTYILRQSLCASFEGNFIYLLIGSEKALLIDTGAIADPAAMPLAKTIMDLLPEAGGTKMPLLVVHTHSHLDHRAGDTQFASLPRVTIAPISLEAMRDFLGLKNWPDGIAQIDLGDRIIEVIPTPGHHSTHVAFYDRRTAILFSGDFLLPGRLVIDAPDAYYRSALRMVAFIQTHPLTYVLGGHIELNAAGEAFAMGSHYHPNEHRLDLSKEDLLALPRAFKDFNGFYARHPNFILSNPKHNLAALAVIALGFLALLAWGVRRLLRRRRRVAA